MKREFVMLAHQYDENKHKLANTFISEKLDGMRAIWLPFTRGMKKKDVPFANIDKDERLLEDQVCTGLWSRLGNIIHAPDYWLDGLPQINLDGELYSRNIPRQDLMSIVKKLPKNRHDGDWEEVSLYVFDSPHKDIFFSVGNIKTTNFTKDMQGVRAWADKNGAAKSSLSVIVFHMIQKKLAEILVDYPRTVLVEQEEMPTTEAEAKQKAFYKLEQITENGGEGLMARVRYSTYNCSRSHSLFKLKKLEDGDGVVVGYITGRRTDKGSKLLGLMGALILKLDNGKTLELSGFTDDERRFSNQEQTAWAEEYPEKRCPSDFNVPKFPVGSRVSFRYRGLSNDGIPNEARYWRKRLDD